MNIDTGVLVENVRGYKIQVVKNEKALFKVSFRPPDSMFMGTVTDQTTEGQHSLNTSRCLPCVEAHTLSLSLSLSLFLSLSPLII